MISKLSIGNVRSLDGIEYEFDPGINVICGPNGCGKTTILESVHLLAQGFSFRAKELKELVAWKADELLLRGTFNYDGRETVRAVCVPAGRASLARNKVVAKENGEAVRSVTSFFGTCPAVIMQPSDIELLRGAPEVRRHWLDEILCFRSAGNAEILRRYRRVLQQRNQWLRQYKRDGKAVGGEDVFRILTEQLVDLGAKLWVARMSLSAEVSRIITNYYRKLSGGVDEITCNYRSSILKALDALDVAESMTDDEIDEAVAGVGVSEAESGSGLSCDDLGGCSSGGSDCCESDTPDEALFRRAFTGKLAGLELAERSLGMTLAGPHRDDLSICASGYEMRSVGSQGQCRSAAVAMRFAAVDVALQYVSRPVLLLDDIFAELDVNRRDAVATLIREKGCQVLIATPQAEELPFKADRSFAMNLKA